MRVLLGLSTVTGYLIELRDGLREIGHEVTLLSAYPSKFFGQPSDRPNLLARVWLATGANNRRRLPRFLRIPAYAVHAAVSVLVAAWVSRRFDAVVFEAGLSFLHGWDLRLFRRRGLRTVILLHGSDARPPFLHGTYMSGELDARAAARVEKATRRVRRRIRRIEPHADAVICHPAFCHFLTRPYIHYSAVGLPRTRRQDASEKAGRPVVLHAPSDAGLKGTPQIRQWVAELEEEGLDFAYLEIGGATNDEVLQALARSAVLADSLYSDVPMAALATEAALLGVPAVVGSEHDIASSTPAPWHAPVVVVRPGGYKAALRQLIADAAMRDNLGRAAQEFVRRRNHRVEVAKRYVRILEGDVPAEWIFRPDERVPCEGYGIAATRLRSQLHRYVTGRGPTALRLDDKPGLRDGLLSWCGYR